MFSDIPTYTKKMLISMYEGVRKKNMTYFLEKDKNKQIYQKNLVKHVSNFCWYSENEIYKVKVEQRFISPFSSDWSAKLLIKV